MEQAVGPRCHSLARQLTTGLFAWSMLSTSLLASPQLYANVSPQQSGGESSSPARTALIVTVIILLTALIGLIVRFMELRRAKIELEKLKGPSADWIETAEKMFQRSRCAGSAFCKEVVCLSLSDTFESAARRLTNIGILLKQGQALSASDIGWARDEFVSSCDGPKWSSLNSPGNKESVETKALECYAFIASKLTDATRVHQAIEDCRRWLRSQRQHLRKETVRLLLPALLRIKPQEIDLVNLYAEAIRGGRQAQPQSRDDEDISELALSRLRNVVSDLTSPTLLMLLQAGLSVAAERWDPQGFMWAETVRASLRGKCLAQTELATLAKQVSAHERFQEPAILEDGRRPEYEALISILADVRKEFGILCGVRPKNRHIATGQVPAWIDFPSTRGQTRIEGNLGNFSFTNSGWQPGAWVTPNNSESRVNNTDWQLATLTIDPNSDLRIVLECVQVLGTRLQDGHTCGFRIKFGGLTSENRSKLQDLACRFPDTR